MESIDLNSKVIEETSVALGFFDGIHKGHQAVIEKTVRNKDTLAAVFTFNQSPLLTLNGQAPDRIVTNKQKHELFKKLGVNILLSVDFKDIVNLTAEEFVKQILIDKLNAQNVYCGFNFTFGRGGLASADDLKKLCNKYGIKTEAVPPVFQDGNIISSTAIREFLRSGKVESANRMLKRNFSLKLVVVHGKKIGRILGTPTINQILPDDFIKPKFGVYASLVKFDDVITYGITNIGVKPTVGYDLPLAETFMPMYKGDDIYGKEVEISLIEFIRPEIKFDGLEALKKQILLDVEHSKNVFAMKNQI